MTVIVDRVVLDRVRAESVIDELLGAMTPDSTLGFHELVLAVAAQQAHDDELIGLAEQAGQVRFYRRMNQSELPEQREWRLALLKDLGAELHEASARLLELLAPWVEPVTELLRRLEREKVVVLTPRPGGGILLLRLGPAYITGWRH